MPSLKSAVLAAAISRATVVANSPNIAIDHSAVRDVAQKITGNVAPIIEHATNTEPWYRSRVTVGAIVSMGTGVLSALGFATDGIDSETVVMMVMAAGSVVGGAFTLYGRWAARRPMGV